MKVLLAYVLWLVVMVGTVECNYKNDNEHNNNTVITTEIQKTKLELDHLRNLPRHLSIFKLKEKLEYLKNLKNLFHQHLATFITDKFNVFHQTPTAEPPTTINIISTTGQETTTDDYFTIISTTTMVPNNTAPVPCYQENDLAIAIDASGSVGSENYKSALEFGARLLSTWKLYDRNGVAAAVFASSVRPIFKFEEGAQLSQNGVKMAILTAPYLATQTFSHLALDWALNEHISNNSTIQKNLVFLTDGFSNYPQLTLDAARKLKRHKIRVFTVGVGPAINQNELVQIAGDEDEHVFTTDTFMDLFNILKPVSEIICV